MKYPRRLVKQFGAKAGYLIYIAEQLPHIPQVDMIVKTPDETIEDALKRADKEGILWPRVFRSSAVAELLGYEGAFPSYEMDSREDGMAKIQNPFYSGPYSNQRDYEEFLRRRIQDIEESPQWLKEEGGHQSLPDKIAVIIGEKSPSDYFGTYIKHSNQEGFYVISVTLASSKSVSGRGDNPIHAAFFADAENSISSAKGFTDTWLQESRNPPSTEDLERVVSWHDEIASLPLVDDDWVYQIEFGINPPCLYQVRPFKPKEMVSHTVKGNIPSWQKVIVVGTAPKKGLVVTVEKDLWDRHCRDEVINPRGVPTALVGEMRDARHIDLLPNHQVSLLGYAHGLLAHEDISAMRQSRITVLYSGAGPKIKYQQGDRLRIHCDGTNVQIVKLSK